MFRPLHAPVALSSSLFLHIAEGQFRILRAEDLRASALIAPLLLLLLLVLLLLLHFIRGKKPAEREHIEIRGGGGRADLFALENGRISVRKRGSLFFCQSVIYYCSYGLFFLRHPSRYFSLATPRRPFLLAGGKPRVMKCLSSDFIEVSPPRALPRRRRRASWG